MPKRNAAFVTTAAAAATTLGLAALLAPAACAQNPAATVTVDASANRHAIDPRIYGIAYGTTANLTDLNFVLNRYGGNNATRYNWQLNADNRGSDWYFESIADSSSIAGERGDTFITNTRNAGVGAQPLITIPLIGYVANLGASRAKLDSFSVAKYGAQQQVDPYWSDAGNGVKSGGGNVTGNNPLDANVAADSTFQKGWVQHLVSKFGTAANGGLKYYIYDNEPSLWQSTHRDVHPTGPTMDEIKNKFIDYGNMIKSVDPNALVVGPEEWGWSGYLYSGYDQQYGSLHGWSTLPDRNNHGGMDYLPWLLDQMRQYQTANNKRLLDIFTVHWYPQGGEYGNDVSTNMQLLRNKSTRSLWDPAYIDQSWVNATVQLIPRLKGWVNQYYPGTLVGITEYNWGAESHINGATTQADILGIFGRESLDLATRWTTPDPTTPTYKAMKLYRNYDGNKSTFGDTSIQASVANPDNVSAFASVRSSDGALTVMAIAKYLSGTTPLTVNLSNFTPAGNAQVYQLTSANTISHLSDITLSGSALSATLPAQSVTLFVVPAKPAFTTSASASPNPVTHGAPTTITVQATDTGGPLSGGIVDMEIYNASGQLVNQQTATGQSFSHNQTRPFTFNWTPTTAGTYTIKVGIFNSTWGTLYGWNNSAATLTVK